MGLMIGALDFSHPASRLIHGPLSELCLIDFQIARRDCVPNFLTIRAERLRPRIRDKNSAGVSSFKRALAKSDKGF